MDEVDRGFAVFDGERRCAVVEVDVFIVEPGVADGEDQAAADVCGGHDDVLAGALFFFFIDGEEGLCGVFEGEGGDFFHVDHGDVVEEGVVGELGVGEGGVGVVAVVDGVAEVGIEGDAEAGG